MCHINKFNLITRICVDIIRVIFYKLGPETSFDDTSLRRILSMKYWNYVTIIHSLFYIARIDWNRVLEEPIPIQDSFRLQSAAEPKKIFIAALIIAWKATHDEQWQHREIEDFTVQQFVDAELVFLRLIDHNVNLHENAFSAFKDTVIAQSINDLLESCRDNNIIVS